MVDARLPELTIPCHPERSEGFMYLNAASEMHTSSLRSDDHSKVLARGRLQLLDQPCHRADALHLFDIFGIELHSKFFFGGENQIQMLHGIPILDAFRRRFRRDFVGWNSENITG